jgi:hypothetical protein
MRTAVLSNPKRSCVAVARLAEMGRTRPSPIRLPPAEFSIRLTDRNQLPGDRERKRTFIRAARVKKSGYERSTTPTPVGFRSNAVVRPIAVFLACPGDPVAADHIGGYSIIRVRSNLKLDRINDWRAVCGESGSIFGKGGADRFGGALSRWRSCKSPSHDRAVRR